MPIKKSELYSSLWKSCDELRGGMDASQYKAYVLVLLFVKYVSDKYAGQPDALIEVPQGGSFQDMVALNLLERHHNDRFASLMDKFMPQWRLHRDELNRSALRHGTWDY
jgi:type I restriction enzyme M protein